MNKTVLKDSLLVTLVITAIVLGCSVMADAVSEPVQIIGGLTSKQIKDSQNITLLLSHPENNIVHSYRNIHNISINA